MLIRVSKIQHRIDKEKRRAVHKNSELKNKQCKLKLEYQKDEYEKEIHKLKKKISAYKRQRVRDKKSLQIVYEDKKRFKDLVNNLDPEIDLIVLELAASYKKFKIKTSAFRDTAISLERKERNVLWLQKPKSKEIENTGNPNEQNTRH